MVGCSIAAAWYETTGQKIFKNDSKPSNQSVCWIKEYMMVKEAHKLISQMKISTSITKL